ncbi:MULTISPECIES: anaerobic ribonucleoside-triphosphate reductase activating protein [Peptoniphilus]|jgi:anaerobic ribonucleoside-triphosphate reductase activating protein|uniref:anaerobic ribonucleoside-triphosphate reductase activating protein n=1 Tax=Peptoniphilus TaxID=162289 RepID=UPI0002883BFA|nr:MULTISPECIES: anaerobic ribonucleoside-triphosphate reductase activating protein [Peptoniphilus]MBS6610400.1 anaerobic ribonucleoside-triphosphate reductase activating protein [Peptoniphilus harei]MDU1043570.1 anaerobic ribonucleoside-triphosphate reductase activating protein [Peptoniphilus rhinitidis]MDU1954601.1 anaerobic ribonucleoside-triphosphate reductase activating protein [Peptoniphilus lacydonensis]MDU2110056.1 anaerobic ribonucleoside-triphosphate reductase activating protein [Pept
MNYAQIRKYDVANGPGIRSTIFVTGCTHNCYNCFNKEYQDFNFGKTWTDKETKEVIEYLELPEVKGLTVLGGEPFQNEVDLLMTIKDIKKEVQKDIWIFSGYTFEEIIKDENKKNLLEECDVLVDGRFVENLKDLTLRFRGSSNQRIIDVKRSLDENKVIELNF